jgi:hypothetical protein
MVFFSGGAYLNQKWRFDENRFKIHKNS